MNIIRSYKSFVQTIGRVGQPVAALLARATIGLVFVESGWGKLHNLDTLVGFFTELGIPFPAIQAPFVATTELVAGTLVLVGLLTRLASVPLIATMVVAILTARRSEIGSVGDVLGFIEYLYIVISVYLVVYGGGALSIDAIAARRWGRAHDA